MDLGAVYVDLYTVRVDHEV